MLIEVPRVDAPLEFDEKTEANHRIANHLALLGSLIRLQAQQLRHTTAPVNPAEVAMTLGSLQTKLLAVARLHRELARPQQTGRVELGSYLREMVSTVVESLSLPSVTDLDLHIDASCYVGSRSALRVALIVCEVVTNSLKYAHPSGISGHLSLACRREGPDLIVEIEDDGVGLPDGFDPETSGNVGFRSLRALASDLNATMSFVSDSLGVTFALRVPMSDIVSSVDGGTMRASGRDA